MNLKTGEKSVVTSGLRKPKGVAVMSDGTVLVVNVGTKELVKIDPKTGAIESFVQICPWAFSFPRTFCLPLHSVVLRFQKQEISMSPAIRRM